MDLFARTLAEQNAKNEVIKRRQIRMEQARRQASEWNKASTEEFRKVKAKEVKELIDAIIEETQHNLLLEIKEMMEYHDEGVDNIGIAHEAALNQPDRKKEYQKKMRENRIKAQKRFKEALAKKREEETKMQHESVKLLNVRTQIFQEATLRAKMLPHFSRRKILKARSKSKESTKLSQRKKLPYVLQPTTSAGSHSTRKTKIKVPSSKARSKSRKSVSNVSVPTSKMSGNRLKKKFDRKRSKEPKDAPQKQVPDLGVKKEHLPRHKYQMNRPRKGREVLGPRKFTTSGPVSATNSRLTVVSSKSRPSSNTSVASTIMTRMMKDKAERDRLRKKGTTGTDKNKPLSKRQQAVSSSIEPLSMKEQPGAGIVNESEENQQHSVSYIETVSESDEEGQENLEDYNKAAPTKRKLLKQRQRERSLRNNAKTFPTKLQVSSLTVKNIESKAKRRIGPATAKNGGASSDKLRTGTDKNKPPLKRQQAFSSSIEPLSIEEEHPGAGTQVQIFKSKSQANKTPSSSERIASSTQPSSKIISKHAQGPNQQQTIPIGRGTNPISDTADSAQVTREKLLSIASPQGSKTLQKFTSFRKNLETVHESEESQQNSASYVETIVESEESQHRSVSYIETVSESEENGQLNLEDNTKAGLSKWELIKQQQRESSASNIEKTFPPTKNQVSSLSNENIESRPARGVEPATVKNGYKNKPPLKRQQAVSSSIEPLSMEGEHVDTGTQVQVEVNPLPNDLLGLIYPISDRTDSGSKPPAKDVSTDAVVQASREKLLSNTSPKESKTLKKFTSSIINVETVNESEESQQNSVSYVGTGSESEESQQNSVSYVETGSESEESQQNSVSYVETVSESDEEGQENLEDNNPNAEPSKWESLKQQQRERSRENIAKTFSPAKNQLSSSTDENIESKSKAVRGVGPAPAKNERASIDKLPTGTEKTKPPLHRQQVVSNNEPLSMEEEQPGAGTQVQVSKSKRQSNKTPSSSERSSSSIQQSSISSIQAQGANANRQQTITVDRGTNPIIDSADSVSKPSSKVVSKDAEVQVTNMENLLSIALPHGSKVLKNSIINVETVSESEQSQQESASDIETVSESDEEGQENLEGNTNAEPSQWELLKQQQREIRERSFNNVAKTFPPTKNQVSVHSEPEEPFQNLIQDQSVPHFQDILESDEELEGHFHDILESYEELEKHFHDLMSSDEEEKEEAHINTSEMTLASSSDEEEEELINISEMTLASSSDDESGSPPIPVPLPGRHEKILTDKRPQPPKNIAKTFPPTKNQVSASSNYRIIEPRPVRGVGPEPKPAKNGSNRSSTDQTNAGETNRVQNGSQISKASKTESSTQTQTQVTVKDRHKTSTIPSQSSSSEQSSSNDTSSDSSINKIIIHIVTETSPDESSKNTNRISSPTVSLQDALAENGPAIAKNGRASIDKKSTGTGKNKPLSKRQQAVSSSIEPLPIEEYPAAGTQVQVSKFKRKPNKTPSSSKRRSSSTQQSSTSSIQAQDPNQQQRISVDRGTNPIIDTSDSGSKPPSVVVSTDRAVQVQAMREKLLSITSPQGSKMLKKFMEKVLKLGSENIQALDTDEPSQTQSVFSDETMTPVVFINTSAEVTNTFEISSGNNSTTEHTNSMTQSQPISSTPTKLKTPEMLKLKPPPEELSSILQLHGSGVKENEGQVIKSSSEKSSSGTSIIDKAVNCKYRNSSNPISSTVETDAGETCRNESQLSKASKTESSTQTQVTVKDRHKTSTIPSQNSSTEQSSSNDTSSDSSINKIIIHIVTETSPDERSKSKRISPTVSLQDALAEVIDKQIKFMKQESSLKIPKIPRGNLKDTRSQSNFNTTSESERPAPATNISQQQQQEQPSSSSSPANREKVHKKTNNEKHDKKKKK